MWSPYSEKNSRTVLRFDPRLKGECFRLGPRPRRHLWQFGSRLLLRMPLMAMSQTNTSPFLIWNHVWTITPLSSFKMSGTNKPVNKLRKISSKLNEFLTSCPSNRSEETVLSRLHVGHSYMTHSFLLKGEDPTFCVPRSKLFSQNKCYCNAQIS